MEGVQPSMELIRRVMGRLWRIMLTGGTCNRPTPTKSLKATTLHQVRPYRIAERKNSKISNPISSAMTRKICPRIILMLKELHSAQMLTGQLKQVLLKLSTKELKLTHTRRSNSN